MQRGWYVLPASAHYFEGLNGTGLSKCGAEEIAEDAVYRWTPVDAGVIPLCEDCRHAISREVHGPSNEGEGP